MMLRTRVALTTVGLLAVGLLGTALVSAMAIRHVAATRGETHVTTAAVQVEVVLTMVDTGPSANPEPIVATLRAVLDRNTPIAFAAVVATDGRELAGAGAVPDPALAAAGARRHTDGSPVRGASADSLRLGVSRVENGSERTLIRVERLRSGAMIVVGTDTGATDALIRTVILTVLLVPLCALVATGAASWWLVHRGLRPLARMAAAADTIGADGIRPGIEVPARFGEGRVVAQAFNRMLGRIEGALRERDASEERLRRFVDDAAHELRTPIATIRGYAALFRRGAAERPEDLATVLARVESEAERMGLLVDDLLALAALDQAALDPAGRAGAALDPAGGAGAGPIEGGPVERLVRGGDAVDLVVLAAEAVEAVTAAYRGALQPGDASTADQALTVRVVAEGPVTVHADPVAVRRVLDNLLANVARHTPPGTPAEVRVTPDDDGVLLAVADRGPGLPPNDTERVFERFYRGSGPRSAGPGSSGGAGLGSSGGAGLGSSGGAGLGLAIVAAIAASRGWTVVARNRTGGGALVGVRIGLEEKADRLGKPGSAEAATVTA